MIRGLDIFRERFRGHGGSLVLIGGAACDDWFARQNLRFRATKDLDIVLLLEAVDRSFVAAMRRFIDEGGYQIRRRSEGGPPVLYRFSDPRDRTFPVMLEIFSRSPDRLSLADGQTIVPISPGDAAHSLSAILVDNLYYDLIRDHSEPRDGISFATATALIPLKTKAWLDLNERQEKGERIDSRDIKKHRADVFRLAGTLPENPGPQLHAEIRADISRFLDGFPSDSPEWAAILASVKPTLGGAPKPAVLTRAIRTYFDL